MLRELELGQVAAVSNSAQQLVVDYRGTAYGDTALLMLARISVENENYQEAISYLSNIVENSKDSAFQHIARLRWATLELNYGDLDVAERLLKTEERGSFASRYDELQGDMYAAKGEMQKAKQAYQMAIESASSAISREILSRKLNLISGVVD